MKRIYRFILAALTVAAVVSFQSCSDDDDDNKNGKIVLAEGQEKVMNFDANQTSGSLNFVAAANWTLTLRADEHASQGAANIDWLTLSRTTGQPGNTVVDFTLKPNKTGVSRTAYIAIECDDETKTIRINQRANDDPGIDKPEASEVLISRVDYEPVAGGGYEVEEKAEMSLSFDELGRLAKMTATRRDNLSADPSRYSETVVLTRLVYNGNNVLAEIDETETDFPSGNNEKESTVHNATLADGRVIAEWWKDNDGVQVDFTMSYDEAGYLTSSKRGNIIMTTQWQNGNLIALTSPNLGAAMTYDNASLVNKFANFNLAALLTSDIETYEIAAGDPSAIWAVAGLVGKSSALIPTTVTETEGLDTDVYTFEFSENTTAKTIVKVSRTDNGRDDGYTLWTLNYGSGVK